MKTSDEDLALAAAGGDADAFSTLLARHYDRVFRLAFRLTGRADRAEDLTQDICAALPVKIAGFRPCRRRMGGRRTPAPGRGSRNGRGNGLVTQCNAVLA